MSAVVAHLNGREPPAPPRPDLDPLRLRLVNDVNFLLGQSEGIPDADALERFFRERAEDMAWGFSKDDASKASVEEPLSKSNPPPARFAPVCAHDFLRQVFPKRELVLGPWLPEKGLAMLAAPRGVGKTHVALGIAYAVASAGEFLRWRAPRRRRVLYLDGEMPAVALQERLASIVQRAAAEPEPGALAFLAADQCEFGLPDLSTPDGQALLRPCMEPFDLIVLDNLSTLCRSGRENEAESWGAVQGFLLELRRAGKSVLLVHHTGKGGQQRGTSKREDVLDSVLLLKRPDDYEASEGARFTVHYDKARGFHGREAEPFEAKLDRLTGEWRTDTATASRDAEIREMHESGASVRDIAAELDLSKSAVQRALSRMREATP